MGKPIDLTGQRFGKLLVLQRGEYHIEPSGRGVITWICQCDCGTIKSICGSSLRKGKTKSCGCGNMFEDLTGQRFGRLVAISRAETIKSTTRWYCKCDCGNTKIVTAGNLKNGTTTSCGCYALEGHKMVNITHGDCYRRIYKMYRGTKYRCDNKNNQAYNLYGGRGIIVCPEWLGEKGYQNFLKWSMNNGYMENLTLDRIDPNGNYEPNNCRWVTIAEQQNNKRSNSLITYNGKTQNITQWSKEIGIKIGTISYRKRHGWTDEECITGIKNGRSYEYLMKSKSTNKCPISD